MGESPLLVLRAKRSLPNTQTSPKPSPFVSANTRPRRMESPTGQLRPERSPFEFIMSTPEYMQFLQSMGPQAGGANPLDCLAGMTREERASLEKFLLNLPALAGRDVQALARLGTPGAIARLHMEIESGTPHPRLEAAIQLHLLKYDIAVDEVLEDSLVAGLRDEALLAQTLSAIERFRRVRLVHALLRATLQGRGESAALCAAMACFLREKTLAGFDWSERTFFLRFNTKDRAARRLAFAELCGRLGVDPVPFLSVSSHPGLGAYLDSRQRA